MSTNFNVIQAQRDLAVARNSELQAQLDYQLALIAFETVQRVGGSGGTSVGGSSTPGSFGSIAPLPAVASPTTSQTTLTGPGGGF
jgi:outer membrane protein TolC